MALVRPLFRSDDIFVCIVPFAHFKTGDLVSLPVPELKVAFQEFKIAPNNNPWGFGALDAYLQGMHAVEEYHEAGLVEESLDKFKENGDKVFANPTEAELPVVEKPAPVKKEEPVEAEEAPVEEKVEKPAPKAAKPKKAKKPAPKKVEVEAEAEDDA